MGLDQEGLPVEGDVEECGADVAGVVVRTEECGKVVKVELPTESVCRPHVLKRLREQGRNQQAIWKGKPW